MKIFVRRNNDSIVIVNGKFGGHIRRARSNRALLSMDHRMTDRKRNAATARDFTADCADALSPKPQKIVQDFTDNTPVRITGVVQIDKNLFLHFNDQGQLTCACAG